MQPLERRYRPALYSIKRKSLVYITLLKVIWHVPVSLFEQQQGVRSIVQKNRFVKQDNLNVTCPPRKTGRLIMYKHMCLRPV